MNQFNTAGGGNRLFYTLVHIGYWNFSPKITRTLYYSLIHFKLVLQVKLGIHVT